MGERFIIGYKLGMTRVFDSKGVDFPVTILEAGPCSVTQLKSDQKDGYFAVQIGYKEKQISKTNSAQKGHFKAASVTPKVHLKEFLVNSLDGFEVGKDLDVSNFSPGDMVSVSGVSKGKGFSGHMKRHNFSGGRRSHGKNSVMRKSGAVGAGSDPSRIWPGTRMAGRMGNQRVTVKNLEIVRIDEDRNLIFVKGSVPGSKKNIVYIVMQ